MRNNTVVGIVVIVVLILLVLIIATLRESFPRAPWNNGGNNDGQNNGENVFCTLDAKLCSDGSYVGRVAPDCEFAACPIPDGASTSTNGQNNNNDEVRIEARINQSASSLGVKITPVEVIEDSRCPIDVQCIQAGTVRLRANIESNNATSVEIFTLGTIVTTDTEQITLVTVSPNPTAGVNIPPSSYVFTFEIMKR